MQLNQVSLLSKEWGAPQIFIIKSKDGGYNEN